MLKTDLNGLASELHDNLINNKAFQILLILLGCFLLYCFLNTYIFTSSRNDFGNVMILKVLEVVLIPVKVIYQK